MNDLTGAAESHWNASKDAFSHGFDALTSN
ncbi:hypothetical protein IWX87_003060 [Polaromonas sp. CG_9.7]|nr:hypothetical protein [Polaromonas sp. CG_9.7]MBG6115373.1 hypothetical protein [Polaromonas sp. CG_9.2]MDH6182921.1 hypothetical protein [Polaromonas sp. CG_23.6]